MHTTEEERRKYAKMWSIDDYRRNSPGLNIAPTALDLLGAMPGQSIIEYGCGDGRALDYFTSRDMDATGVDLMALRPDIIEASLWELPEDLAADFAFCADVLEHIPPERVAEALAAMRERTGVAAAFTVATIGCTVGERHGEDLHLTIRPAWWWWREISKCWGSVEHHHTDREWRHLFIVRA